jgi:hypothetical protein
MANGICAPRLFHDECPWCHGADLEVRADQARHDEYVRCLNPRCAYTRHGGSFPLEPGTLRSRPPLLAAAP